MASLDRIEAGLHPVVPGSVLLQRLRDGLQALVAWLLGHRVTAVVLEATGIYWETPCKALDGVGILPLLVHAQHFRQIRGYTTDVADSVWLTRVYQFGLCKPSLVPLTEFRSLRKISR